jgi:hypothetical protein
MKKEEIGQFLGKTSKALLEGATGVASTDKKELIKSAGQLLQHVRGGHFLNELKKEWDDYRAKGRIEPDYQNTDQCWDNLKEVLEAIDKDMPDRTRFEAMKAIFLKAASEDVSSRNDILPYELMKLTRRLTSAQILILSACYYISENEMGQYYKLTSYAGWNDAVRNRSGLEYKEIVDFEELTLTDLGLLTKRQHGDGSGIVSDRFRLTKLGLKLCEFIAQPKENQPE